MIRRLSWRNYDYQTRLVCAIVYPTLVRIAALQTTRENEREREREKEELYQNVKRLVGYGIERRRLTVYIKASVHVYHRTPHMASSSTDTVHGSDGVHTGCEQTVYLYTADVYLMRLYQ